MCAGVYVYVTLWADLGAMCVYVCVCVDVCKCVHVYVYVCLCTGVGVMCVDVCVYVNVCKCGVCMCVC